MTPSPSSSFYDNSDPPRAIHIWEFPKEFWVRLDAGMVRELVDCAAESVGDLKQLVSILNVSKFTVYNSRAERSFIPLPTLLKLCDLAGDEYAIEQVEPSIVAYKGGWAVKRPIRNPKLPLVETPDLFALMGHLMGDGGYSGNEAYYANTSPSLVDKFISLLRGVFGDVPNRVRVNRPEGARSISLVWFGLTVVQLLRHLYQIDFRTFTARVPRRLFELPREYAAAFLRAFGDDEGTVHDDWIALYSANQELMQDIYGLVQAKFPELDEFGALKEKQRKSGTDYFLHFRTGAFTRYEALIGFTHPKKKQELERILTCRARGWRKRNEGATRKMILEALVSSGFLTRKDLAKRVNVTYSVVRGHLKGLTYLGFVRVGGKDRGAKLYEITERGRKILRLPSLGHLVSGRTYQSKLDILKTLAGEPLTTKTIGQKLGRKHDTIQHQLTRIGQCGKWSPGLLELGLVDRYESWGRSDPYVYLLTDTGRQVVEALDTLFTPI